MSRDNAPLLYDPEYQMGGLPSVNREGEDVNVRRRSFFIPEGYHHDDVFIAISPYLIELLGAYFLTLIIGLDVLQPTGLGPLAIGSGLMVTLLPLKTLFKIIIIKKF